MKENKTEHLKLQLEYYKTRKMKYEQKYRHVRKDYPEHDKTVINLGDPFNLMYNYEGKPDNIEEYDIKRLENARNSNVVPKEAQLMESLKANSKILSNRNIKHYLRAK